jgi:hypothetical protein
VPTADTFFLSPEGARKLFRFIIHVPTTEKIGLQWNFLRRKLLCRLTFFPHMPQLDGVMLFFSSLLLWVRSLYQHFSFSLKQAMTAAEHGHRQDDGQHLQIL